MSEDKKKLVDRIEEEDRVVLHEDWLELVALNNAVSAMRAEVAKLQSDIMNYQTQIQTYTDRGTKMDSDHKDFLKTLKDKYEIPEDHNIDSKTGKVYPPDVPLPQSEVPLISRRG
jgi:hypothetical protein